MSAATVAATKTGSNQVRAAERCTTESCWLVADHGGLAAIAATVPGDTAGYHRELVTRSSAIKVRGPAGEACVAATYPHQLGDYLRAALSLGFQVRQCEEPGAAQPTEPLPEPAAEIGDWQDWPRH